MCAISLHVQSLEYTRATFHALTDSLLPSFSQGNYSSGSYGSARSDQGVHDYIIYGLDHYISIQEQLFHKTIPLSKPTAMLLDASADQLVNANLLHAAAKSYFPGGGMFSCLSRTNRLRVLTALENIELDLYSLPSPYQNNAGLIQYMTDALNRLAMFGYYSEWPAYGSTRLYPPSYRRLEYFPPVWEQVGYPGVAYGYRDFRGFLLKMGRDAGGVT